MLEASRGEELEGYAMAWPDPLVRIRVRSKTRSRAAKFGRHGIPPLGSRVIRYVRDGGTDGRTDEQKQRLLPPPYGWAHNNLEFPDSSEKVSDKCLYKAVHSARALYVTN